MKIIKKVYRRLSCFHNHIKWEKQTKEIYSNDDLTDSAKELELDFRYIIIVPHADDELLGCHSMIKKCKNQIKLIYLGYVGDDGSISNKQNRCDEFHKYCDFMNVSFEEIQNEEELFQIIVNFKPHRIALPVYVDWHMEHRKANTLIKRIMRNCSDQFEILWYQISVPIPLVYTQRYMNLTKKECYEKFQIFHNIYKSQSHLPIDRFQLSMKYYGRRKSLLYLERYMVLSRNDWERIIELDLQGELLLLKSGINNLAGIQNQTKKIFDQII